ncbi:MAG: DNA recombination protein RmuC, partial [Spirochaetaceae bacterium]
NPALLLRACMQIGVVPASPSNLFLYLQTIAYGLRGMDFSQNFTKYAALFELIRQETRQLFDVLNTGNTHLRNSQRNFDTALQKTRDMQRNLDESLDQA